MRIVIDMQGAQTESHFRGIGRYTLSLAHAIVRNRGKHEVILALNGLFPDTIEPIRAAFDGLLPHKNIRVWYAPGPIREMEQGNIWRREASELIREAFLASLRPDVVLVSSLFEGYVDDAASSIGIFASQIPTAVILYDLIPLLNPDAYLKPNPAYARYYHRKIEYLKHADLWLAISESAATEGRQALGLGGDSVANISTACDPVFRPLEIEEPVKQQLLARFNITQPFILYSGGADARKNLPRLVRAYAQLPMVLRDAHQLLLAGKMPEGEMAELQRISESSGLRDKQLSFTGYVTDEELVQFYNLCAVFVLPSLHEGFGLPALEAMSCGAAVIGSNTSSVPEVIDRTEALFDPRSEAAITQKLAQVLGDAAFRAELAAHGPKQAKKFSWNDSAMRAMAAFKNLGNHRASNEALTWRQVCTDQQNNYHRLINAIANVASHGDSPTDSDLRLAAAGIASNQKAFDYLVRAREMPEEIVWRIEGPFDSSYSLALLNRETARVLDAMGHRVVLHSTEGPGDFPPNRGFLEANPDLNKFHARTLKTSQEEADVTSRNLYPPRVADMNCRLNLLHHYAWEESGFPQEWVDDFNSHLQGVTCLSRHVEKIMVDHGVTIPLSVSGCGVDHWERVQADPMFRVEGKSFRFLHVSSCFPRKGADVLLTAYGQEFSSQDDCTLIIKTFPNPHNEVHQWLLEAKAERPDFPDVKIIEDDLSDAQLKSLYGQCHALVAPSRAEGFGLPMAEAMLTILPVITTGWSGQLDFCNDETAWLVDYRFKPARTHFDLFDSVWAEPDVASLAGKMREVFEMPQEERRRKPVAGRRLLLEKFRWRNVAERLVGSTRDWARCPEPKEPRMGWITSWNTRCGIATYSEHLVKNLPSKLMVLAAASSSLTTVDGDNVIRCWEAGDHEPMIRLRQEIEQLQLDTLVIQFNYGFFNLETFAEFLVEQVESGRVVVVMMHATSDPTHAPHKKLSILAPALACCHRVLVHAPGDLNRLKALGLVENVSIFPHGVLDYQVTTNTEKISTTFNVVSYGFFLPHKGLLEMIDAVSLLRKRGINVSFSMINAEYPVPDSRLLIEQAVEKIRGDNLAQWIDVCTDYLTDEECLNRLGRADLIIFPYQNTGESSSAAVRYGLASGRPVAVTPMAIFDDVKQAVHYLPGQTAEDIAEGISRLANDFASREGYILEKESSAERWRAAHRYSRLGGRLYGILEQLNNSKNHNYP